ncbi:MAG: DUF6491 family protein [Pseudomonadales bacterium]|jgi:hypothetical protein|nr:DUF6491 family protein [Pseudomonadales bacterium]
MRRATSTILLYAVLASGCAATGGSADRERARADRLYQTLTGMGLVRGESVSRVPNFRISGWNDIDDRTLVLSAGVRDRYLVELRAPCQGLSSSFGIGLATHTGSLMASDSILVRGPGGTPERCAIRAIWALDDLPGYDAAQSDGR